MKCTATNNHHKQTTRSFGNTSKDLLVILVMRRNSSCIETEQYYLCSISVRHGDAGDAVASPAVKNWSLFGQKFSKFGQSIQLHLQVSEVVSISQTKAKQ